MSELKGSERKYLRGLAHGMKPLVTVGQKGMGEALVKALESALNDHELVKMKFNDFKEKTEKRDIVDALTRATCAESVGEIGHTVIFFRRHPDPEKRKIVLPASLASAV